MTKNCTESYAVDAEVEEGSELNYEAHQKINLDRSLHKNSYYSEIYV